MVNEFGAYFKDSRKRLTSLSLNKFAKMLGVSPAYLSRVERGLDIPTYKLILKISECLNIDVNLLAGKAGVIDPKLVAHITKNERLSVFLPRIIENIVQLDPSESDLNLLGDLTASPSDFKSSSSNLKMLQEIFGSPTGIRTPATSLKSLCPNR